MAAYVFTVDKVLVHNCKSKGDHNDSDWLHMDVVIGESTTPEGLFQIGSNIHAGDTLNGPWLVGPVWISENDIAIVSLLIENKSHTDTAKQETEAIIIGTALLTGIAGAASAAASGIKGAAFASEAFADAVYAGMIGTVGAIWATFVGDSDPNCNGEVCHQMFTYDRGDLARLGTHTTETERTGPSTDSCGDAPHTRITYSVTEWTLRQAIKIKQAKLGIEIGNNTISVRAIKPDIGSVRSYMGL